MSVKDGKDSNKTNSIFYGVKGFTLIELLVVIAIIAVLVLIVVVAINPAATVRRSQDQAAASNVRATGTLISVCVADRLSESPPLTYEECALPITINAYGNVPTDVELAAGDSVGDNDVCAVQQGSGGVLGHYYVFRHSVGGIEEETGDLLSLTPADWCP